MPEGVVARFVMHGDRGALARGLAHFEERVTGIERAVDLACATP